MMCCIAGLQTSILLKFTLYLFDFLSFRTLNNEIFVKDFFGIMQARVIKFDMQIVDDVLYCGIYRNRFK